MKYTFKFLQKDYRLKYGPRSTLGGLCFSLTAKWCHMVLSSPKNFWQEPTPTGTDRLGELDQKDVADDVIGNQTVYHLRTERLLHNVDQVAAMVTVARIVNQNSPNNATGLINVIGNLAAENDDREVRIKKNAIEHFGVKMKSRVDTGWAGLAEKLNQGCAIIWFTQNDGSYHAIAVYKASGFMNEKCYVFEPNDGEIECDNTGECQKVFNKISQIYNCADCTVASITL